jgi:hypothetical protein
MSSHKEHYLRNENRVPKSYTIKFQSFLRILESHDNCDFFAICKSITLVKFKIFSAMFSNS